MLFTLVDLELTERLQRACEDSRMSVPICSRTDTGPFSPYLGTASTPRPGSPAYAQFDYFKRIDALNSRCLCMTTARCRSILMTPMSYCSASARTETPTSIYPSRTRDQDGEHPDRSERPAAGFFGVPYEAAGRGSDRPRPIASKIRQNRLLALNADPVILR